MEKVSNRKSINYKMLLLTLLSIFIFTNIFCQDTIKAFFETKIDTLYSDAKKEASKSFKIIVPNQKAFKDAKIEFTVVGNDMNPSGIFLPNEKTIKLNSSDDTIKKEFNVNFQRSKKDDRLLILKLIATDSKGNNIILADSNIVYKIYIKPQSLDTLNGCELWFLTGTNFDLFDGIKSQEFFFRVNTLVKLNKNFYGQFAFYKNRYNSYDTTSGSLPFSSVIKPSIGDSVYTLTSGDYRRTTKQTIDPLALQFDILYKLTNNSESNFFATAGFDFSTSSVSIRNKYEYLDTTFKLHTSRPDTVKGYNSFGTTTFPESISYKKPIYNLNLGLMWIYNDAEINIKTHLTAGNSNYTNLISYYQSRGAGMIYNFEDMKNIYLQLRMFATYKPLGLSFGLESFIRKSEVPAFNFTLSKAFDIKGFIKNFTPVTGLNILKD